VKKNRATETETLEINDKNQILKIHRSSKTRENKKVNFKVSLSSKSRTCRAKSTQPIFAMKPYSDSVLIKEIFTDEAE
jgi:hypothetical protein